MLVPNKEGCFKVKCGLCRAVAGAHGTPRTGKEQLEQESNRKTPQGVESTTEKPCNIKVGGMVILNFFSCLPPEVMKPFQIT